MTDNTLTMKTAFAGKVEINIKQVKKLTTKNRYYIQLSNGKEATGRLSLSENGQQQLTDTDSGTIALDQTRIISMWTLDEKQPVDEQIEYLRGRHAQLNDPWRGNIALGMQGAHGNTERFGVQGRGELYRETKLNRLSLYLEGTYQEDSGDETANQTLAGILLEHDFTDRWFSFAGADFERDEFENLDLRVIATTGVGYFFVRRPYLDFKGRAGAGYQYENFSDGTTQEEPLGELGYDLRYDANSWLRLLHDLTFYPAFTDLTEDFRVVTNLGVEMPLGNSRAWKLRANVRNQYDNQPEADVENLDTTYQLNLLYDWK